MRVVISTPMYCPACNGRVVRSHGWIIEFTDVRKEIKLDDFLACTACPLVTEVDRDKGRLTDLGSVTMAEITAPYVPGIDEGGMPILLQQTTALHGRRDS